MKAARILVVLLAGFISAEGLSGGLATSPSSLEARDPRRGRLTTPKAPTSPRPRPRIKEPSGKKAPTRPKPAKPPKSARKPKSGKKSKSTKKTQAPKQQPKRRKGKARPKKSKTPGKRVKKTKSAAKTKAKSLKGPFTQYRIYVKKPANKAANRGLKKVLAKHVKSPAKDIKEFGIKGKWVNYFELPLNKESVKTLKKSLKRNKQFNGLSKAKCTKNCKIPWAAEQSAAVRDIVFFNQREGTSLADYPDVFHYEDNAGEGVTCYMLDDGADVHFEEFSHHKNVRFIYALDLEPHERKPGVTGRDHGTCMLSRIVGKDFGTAKRCKPVVVKVPEGAKKQMWLNSLTSIQHDIQTQNVRKAVLSMSLYWPLEQITETDDSGALVTDQGWIDGVYENLHALDQLGVVLVASSGNGQIGNKGGAADNNIMDGHPATTALRIPNMIIVGAVDAETGLMWPKSNFDDQKGLTHVFAPGERVHCWEGRPWLKNEALRGKIQHEPSVVDGTSPAAASVAGLAAYFMSLPGGPRTPADVKRKILSTAWVQHKEKTYQKPGPKEPVVINQPSRGIVRVWNEFEVPGVE